MAQSELLKELSDTKNVLNKQFGISKFVFFAFYTHGEATEESDL